MRAMDRAYLDRNNPDSKGTTIDVNDAKSGDQVKSLKAMLRGLSKERRESESVTDG